MKALEDAIRAEGLDPASLTTLSRSGEKDACALKVAPDKCVQLRQSFRAQTNETDYYPLLMSSLDRFSEDMQTFFAEHPVEQIVSSGIKMEAEEWLRATSEDPEYPQASEYRGGWSDQDEQPQSDRQIHPYLLESAKGKISLVFLPVVSSWEAVAYLALGGWNDCPDPEVQVCLLKHWNERYGAELMVEGGDFLECCVSRPPQDRQSAEALALQQFTYCYDIVDQGTETIEALASGLLNSPQWFFWWD